MPEKSIYRHFELQLTAGEVRELDVFGRFLTLLDNSGSTDIKVSVGGDPEEVLPQGISIELSTEANPFTRLVFRNPGGSTVTIKFAVTFGRVLDNRVVISGSLSTDSTPDNLTSPAAAAPTNTASQVIAADADAREYILQNNGAVDIWLGDSNVDGSLNRGFKLAVDEAMVLTTKSAVFARTVSGTGTLSIVKQTA